jgi:hypothetical protein
MAIGMNAIEFQAVAHDGVLDIPPEHRRRRDGKTVRVVLVNAESQDADGNETLFVRLRRVRIQGPTDLSTSTGREQLRPLRGLPWTRRAVSGSDRAPDLRK